jgi:hypothetical protein
MVNNHVFPNASTTVLDGSLQASPPPMSDIRPNAKTPGISKDCRPAHDADAVAIHDRAIHDKGSLTHFGEPRSSWGNRHIITPNAA